jgi:hypothetical protein
VDHVEYYAAVNRTSHCPIAQIARRRGIYGYGALTVGGAHRQSLQRESAPTAWPCAAGRHELDCVGGAVGVAARRLRALELVRWGCADHRPVGRLDLLLDDVGRVVSGNIYRRRHRRTSAPEREVDFEHDQLGRRIVAPRRITAERGQVLISVEEPGIKRYELAEPRPPTRALPAQRDGRHAMRPRQIA